MEGCRAMGRPWAALIPQLGGQSCQTGCSRQSCLWWTMSTAPSPTGGGPWPFARP